MDSWLTAMPSSTSWYVDTKSGFTISFILNFLLLGFFDLLEGVEVNGVFPSFVGVSNEEFGSLVVFSVVVGSLGDGVLLVRVLVGDLVGISLEI